MKGLLYKDFIILKKRFMLGLLITFILSVLCILVRISMDVGNLSHDEESKKMLLNNLWIIAYTPPAVTFLEFCYTGSVFDSDDTCGFRKFCMTTAVNRRIIIAEQYILSFIMCAFSFCLSMVFSLVFTHFSHVSISSDTLKIISVIGLLTLAGSFVCIPTILFFKNKRNSQLFFGIVSIGIYIPFTVYMMSKLDSVGKDGDLFTFINTTIDPVKKYAFPVLIIADVLLLVIGIFAADYGMKRRCG